LLFFVIVGSDLVEPQSYSLSVVLGYRCGFLSFLSFETEFGNHLVFGLPLERVHVLVVLSVIAIVIIISFAVVALITVLPVPVALLVLLVLGALSTLLKGSFLHIGA